MQIKEIQDKKNLKNLVKDNMGQIVLNLIQFF